MFLPDDDEPILADDEDVFIPDDDDAPILEDTGEFEEDNAPPLKKEVNSIKFHYLALIMIGCLDNFRPRKFCSKTPWWIREFCWSICPFFCSWWWTRCGLQMEMPSCFASVRVCPMSHFDWLTKQDGISENLKQSLITKPRLSNLLDCSRTLCLSNVKIKSLVSSWMNSRSKS